VDPPTPGSSVTLQIDHYETPTFAIVASASGTIPSNPGVNRINARFKARDGATAGWTSAAAN
jgi:hypothetical protein